MLLKKTLTLITIALIAINVHGQEIKFGKVSKEELSEKSYPSDESANAAYLYKYRRTYFSYDQSQGFNLVTEIHERIKIYSKEGFDYATKKINLYKDGSDNEKVYGLKAITFNLVAGKIEETKLKKDGEFKIELSKYYDQESFTMPNVKEGSVVDYKYKIISPFISNVDEFVFQHDIPVKKIMASMEAPEYFNFRVNTRGFFPVMPKKENGSGKITLKSKSRTNTRTSTQTAFNSQDVTFQKETTRYNVENVPALKEEPHVNNINNYRAAVKYELAFTKFPDSPIKHYSSTWEDVVKKIYQSPSFGAELDKKGYYDDDIDNLIASISDPLKRTALIFDYVKTKVKWNGYYGKYTHDGVKKAYKERTGNVAEINLMLTSMLRYAGLKANPILVSTRNNGIPLFPTREGYNYVISGVQLENGMVLLDATDLYSSPNMLPVRTLNWEGRLILENGNSKSIDLTAKTMALDVVMLEVTPEIDGSISGKYREQYKNHNAMLFRRQYNTDTEDVFLENEEKENDGIEISNYELKNNKNFNKPIVQSYEFFQEDAIEVINGKIYFSPMYHLATSESPFKLEKREFPVDFGFPWEDKYLVTTKIPEGYQVESLPESKIISLPDNLGTFKYTIKNNGSSVNLSSSLTFNSSTISPQYYDTLKEFYRQLIEKETEKVVLSKITENGNKDSAAGSR